MVLLANGSEAKPSKVGVQARDTTVEAFEMEKPLRLSQPMEAGLGEKTQKIKPTKGRRKQKDERRKRMSRPCHPIIPGLPKLQVAIA